MASGLFFLFTLCHFTDLTFWTRNLTTFPFLACHTNNDITTHLVFIAIRAKAPYLGCFVVQ